MTKTNLNHYRVFVEVYQNKNMSAAAKRLDLTQPTVSYSMRELESQIGVKLFTPRQRGVTATQHADDLYPEILKVLEIITKAEEQLKKS